MGSRPSVQPAALPSLSLSTARTRFRMRRSLDHDSFSSFMLEHGALSWEITRQKTGTIDPDSNGISIWNAWLLAIVLYDSWVVPMLLCFNVINPDICHETWLTNALMSFEIFFAIDIYVQLHTGYYVAGDLVRNSSSTQRRYIHSYQFPLDLLALIPLSFFSFASDQACGVILVNKLLRLRRIPAYTLEFDKVFALYFKFCKSVKMVVVSFFFCHYIACLYVIFGKSHGDEDDVWKIHDESEHGHHRLLTEYFAALFWSSGIVSKCLEGEIPRTLLQTLFMLVVMLGGFLLFVYICGTLFMISKCDTNSVEKFDAKINQLRYILSFHRIPQDVQDRAVEFLENGFNSGDNNDRNTMKLLCPSIAKDVKFTLLKSMVSNIPFFRCCDAAFTRALIDLMETQSLPTNYVVCSKGEQGEEMYFVQSGVLAVLINDIKVRELRKGGFFGELSLFTNQVRTANVVTATFCILHKLSRSHVRRVLRAYPHFEAQIMACVTALLEEMDMQNSDTTKKNSLKMDTVNKRAKAYGAFVGQDNKGAPSSSQDKLKDGPASMKDKSVDEPSVKNFIKWKKFLLRTAINRKSRFRLAWLVGIMIATLYNVFTVPLLNTFQLIDYPISILLLNTLTDVVLWLDIYGKFNLSFVLDAEQIMDPALCAQNYLRASFYFDFICAFPWWILYPSQHLKLRFVRLLRFYKIGEEFEELALFVRINSRRRLLLLGLGLFLCYHIAGCMAHSLALVVGYDARGHGWLPPKTLKLQKVVDNSTGQLLGYDYMDGVRFVPLGDPLVGEIILKQYTRALQYGAVCLTNLGRTLEPENLWEFILAFVLMLSGMLLISLIIDDVQKCVTASAIEQMEFLSTRSRILHFLHKQKASFNMHQRVSAYLDFWWSAHRGANINSLLGELPHSMQHEIYTFMFSPMLDILQRMDHISDKFETVSKLLLDKLIIHLYGQGEIIYRFGDYADSLYILVVGQCAIGRHIRASDTLPARDLKPGDFFGCSSLHLDCEDIVHNDQAFARSACVIAMISRTTLALINQAFPSFCENALRREQKRSGEHRAMSKLLNPTELSSLSKTTKVVVINPDSKFSVFWETILFIGMVYQSIGVPYYMAFGFTVQDVGPSDSISFVLEFCFLIDIALKTRTGYFSYGNKVMDISKIRKRYFRSVGFIIDVLAVLPINLVNAFLEKRSEAWNINKLLRLFKLSSQIEHLERHYYSINIQIRVFKLVFYICLLSHYIGCTWYNFGSNASTIFGFIQDSQFGHDPWLPSAELDLRNHELSTFSKYRRALYWGLGLLLGFEPGQYPETPIEYLFTAVVQTLGVFLLAYVVGNLLDIVQVTEGNNRLFYSNLNYVRKLTSYFEFTEDMKSKIQHYYFYRLFHSIHEEHVLTKCLPPSLVADIRLFLLTPMLKKVPFFKDENASSNVTRSLVRQLCQMLVTRGEVVCRQNEIGVEMYFIFTGCLEVFVAFEKNDNNNGIRDVFTHQRGIKVNELHAGSFFGEKSLFSDQPRNASIEAKTFCTLYKLSRKHLESVFAQHPEWKAKVMDIVGVIYEKQQAKFTQEKTGDQRTTSEALMSNVGQNGDNLQAVSSRFASYVSFSRSLSRNPWLKKITDQILNVEVQSNFYRNYLKTMCSCQLYIALSVPYFVTFGHGGKASVTTIIFRVMDFTTDIVFAYDILFKSQLKETVASREFYEHRLQHDKLGVIADVFTILPLEYMFSSLVRNSTLLRFNRFIKLRQLTSAINEVNLFSMSYEVNRLKLLALYYFIVCYWTACGYFGLTFIEGFASEWNSSLPVEYFNPANHGDNSDIVFSIHQLLRCLYYSGTMYTGIGLVYEPEHMLEFAFTFIISIFGVFVMGYVIGEGSTLCIYLIQNEVEFKINQMNIMEFLSRKRMDRSLHSRVHIYLAYWWSSQQGVAYQSILEQLPSRIRSQACIQIARLSLARFSMRYIRPLCENSLGLDMVMHSIAQRLVYEGYPAGESVIVQGNIGQTMYFVSKGNLITACTTPNFCPTRYVDGQFFGEEGFLASSFCRYSVVTLRASDLLALSSSDFLLAMNEHPQFAECVAISWDAVANYDITLRDLHGPSDVGGHVYSIIERMGKELQFVAPTSIDRAEVMFRHFLRLFVRQMPDDTDEEDDKPQRGYQILCQHCENQPSSLYCKLCLQGLCEECSNHIHKDTHFAFHGPSITKLSTENAKDPASNSVGLSQIVRTWQAFRKSHVVPVENEEKAPSKLQSVRRIPGSKRHIRIAHGNKVATSKANQSALVNSNPSHDSKTSTIPTNSSTPNETSDLQVGQVDDAFETTNSHTTAILSSDASEQHGPMKHPIPVVLPASGPSKSDLERALANALPPIDPCHEEIHATAENS